MKTAVFLALALLCGGALAESAGATLHRASLREWHMATSADQFATVADLIENVLNLRDPLAVAPKARSVQACVSRVAGNFQLGSQLVADTAVACMAELGYLRR
ncbi:MAG: hypothetical protein M3R60_10995 [Pseudomonadota bacterium]|nr:hypothetical protein [Pseudomonadota bacterium]